MRSTAPATSRFQKAAFAIFFRTSFFVKMNPPANPSAAKNARTSAYTATLPQKIAIASSIRAAYSCVSPSSAFRQPFSVRESQSWLSAVPSAAMGSLQSSSRTEARKLFLSASKSILAPSRIIRTSSVRADSAAAVPGIRTDSPKTMPSANAPSGVKKYCRFLK